MITKAYLDLRLQELEDKLERKINAEIGRASDKVNADVDDLKNEIKRIGERDFESKDILTGYVASHNAVKEELESVKSRLEELEKAIGENKIAEKESGRKEENGKDESDTITSDIE